MMALHVLGWTLLHFCWQGAVVAGMLWCVLALLGGRASALRYGAACGALGLMVAAPLVTFWELAVEARRAGLAGQVPVVDWVITVVPGGAGGGHWVEGMARALDGATPWVPWVWMAGVLVFLVRLQVGLALAGRMTTEGTERIAGPLAGRFEELKERLGVRGVVRLVQTARVEVPTVIGWLRPVVLMPVGCLARLSTAQVEALLVHELAHIRRQDYLVNVLQTVVEALLFYHPAVWWVSRQVRLERECCCDRMAAEVGGDALGYAKALSFLETRRAFLQEVALGANGGVLTMRIKRLLGVRESSAVSQGLALALLLAAVMVVPVGYMATMARAERGVGAVPRASRPVETLGSVTVGEVALVEALRPAGRAERLLVARVEVPVAEAQAEPRKVSGGVMAGQLISRPDPVYPAEAKEKRIQGAVVLKAVISKEGTVENLQVVSGPTELVRSALDAVRQWTYKPYLLNGEPIEVETTITINYSFGGELSEAEPKRIGNGVLAPTVLHTENPSYSEVAKREKISGNVLVGLVVDQQGEPTHVRVVRGIGYGLDEKAVEAVKGYKFKPAMEDGKPVAVAMNIQVKFQVF